MLDKLQSLIISEIGDFTAGLGNPGEPKEPEHIHSELMTRIKAVFADINQQYCVNEVKAQAVSYAALLKSIERWIEKLPVPTPSATHYLMKIDRAFKENPPIPGEQVAVIKYHKHLINELINTGAITHPQQISLLQNQLNAYLRENEVDAL